jgi:hypothetical protein
MTSDGTDQRADGTPTLWRPGLTIVLFAALPFVGFLAENGSEAELSFRFFLYPLGLIVIGLALVGWRLRKHGRLSAERAAVLYAVAVFVAFKFVLVGKVTARLGLDSEYFVPLMFWIAGFVVAMWLASKVASHSAAWNYCLIFGVLLCAVSTYEYAKTSSDSDGAAARAQGVVPAEVTASKGKGGPSVWFLMMDGYARADVLKEEFDLDTTPFLREMRKRGFDVNPEAAASYPRTLGSVGSTLAMDYTISVGAGSSLKPLLSALRGRNATVRAFRQLGYLYAAATDYAVISCEGRADVCVKPVDGDGTSRRDVVLDGTPIGHPLIRLQDLLDGEQPRSLLAPQEAVEAIIRDAGEQPVFAYVHLIAPHPPYRYERDCGPRNIPDINHHDWEGSERALYATATRCLNADLLEAVDRILERDQDAVIVIQGDHGPAFDVPLTKSANDWSADEVRQRYGILSALRAGPRCTGRVSAPEVPVNTFRSILGCIVGRDLPLLPAKRFSMVYGGETDVTPLRQTLSSGP